MIKEVEKGEKAIRYGKQLQMLNRLKNLGRISAAEYQKILEGLKRDYRVVSNLLK